jgi:hypothetical protein
MNALRRCGNGPFKIAAPRQALHHAD